MQKRLPKNKANFTRFKNVCPKCCGFPVSCSWELSPRMLEQLEDSKEVSSC